MNKLAMNQLMLRVEQQKRGLPPTPCPDCGNTNLETRALGVEEGELVDVCTQCGCTWIELLAVEKVH